MNKVREQRENEWKILSRMEESTHAAAAVAAYDETMAAARKEGKSIEDAQAAAEKAYAETLAAHEALHAVIKQDFDLETERAVEKEEARIREINGVKAAAKATEAAGAAREEYDRKLKVAQKENNQGLTDLLGLKEKQKEAETAYINALIEEQAKLNTKNNKEMESWATIEKIINQRVEELNLLDHQIETIKKRNEEEAKGNTELSLQNKLDKARADALEKYNETLKNINANRKSGELDEKTADDDRRAAHTAYKDALQGIVDQYNLTSGYTVDLLAKERALVGEAATKVRLSNEEKELADATLKITEDTAGINDQIIKQEIDENRELAKLAKTEDERKRLLEKALDLEIDLTTAQREREKKAYKATEEYQLLFSKNKDEAKAWEKAFDEATDGIIKNLEKLKDEKPLDFEELVANISTGMEYFESAASSVLSITQSMAEDQITTIENLLEQQQELIDAQYEATMERLEEERQAALEAAGFVAAVTEEGLAAAMEAAVGSGDEAVIYKEKRRQEELAINKQYDKLEADAEKKKNADLKAAEEKAAREIADIQYAQAMAEWGLKLAMAPTQIATATLQGLAQLGPFLGAKAVPIMAAIGALQVAAILAAVPKKPALAGGGVVGLPQTYTGGYADGGIVVSDTPRGVDAVDTTLANREMVLNDDQQTNLFKMIAAGQTGGGPITIIVQAVLDGEIVAENTVTYINNGATSLINRRMIQ